MRDLRYCAKKTLILSWTIIFQWNAFSNALNFGIQANSLNGYLLEIFKKTFHVNFLCDWITKEYMSSTQKGGLTFPGIYGKNCQLWEDVINGIDMSFCLWQMEYITCIYIIHVKYIYISIYIFLKVRLYVVYLSVGFPAITIVRTAELDNNADSKSWLTVIGSLILLTSLVEFIPGY